MYVQGNLFLLLLFRILRILLYHLGLPGHPLLPLDLTNIVPYNPVLLCELSHCTWLKSCSRWLISLGSSRDSHRSSGSNLVLVASTSLVVAATRRSRGSRALGEAMGPLGGAGVLGLFLLSLQELGEDVRFLRRRFYLLERDKLWGIQIPAQYSQYLGWKYSLYALNIESEHWLQDFRKLCSVLGFFTLKIFRTIGKFRFSWRFDKFWEILILQEMWKLY